MILKKYLCIALFLISGLVSFSLYAEEVSSFARGRIYKEGLTLVQPDRVPEGAILFVPMYPADKEKNSVRLIDVKTGKVVHSWNMGSKIPGLWGYIPEPKETEMYKGAKKGALFYISQTPIPKLKKKHEYVSWKQDRGGVMELISFEGEVLWRYEDEDQHHDARLTREGSIAYIAAEPMTKGIKERFIKALSISTRMWDHPLIGGGYLGLFIGHIVYYIDAFKHRFQGRPRFLSRDMYADVIKIVNPITKELLFSWKVEDHLSPFTDRLNFNDPLDEWTHANTIVALYEDNVNLNKVTHLLVSFRQISTIIKIDISTGNFERLILYPNISQQHDCTLWQEKEGGDHLLVFNNRYLPNDGGPLPFSMVEEFSLKEVGPHPFNPMIQGPKLVWSYLDGVEFYSAYISGAERIKGFHLDKEGYQYTLITEGGSGRIFIVRTDKVLNPSITVDTEKLEGALSREEIIGLGLNNEIVFEYINPEYSRDPLPRNVALGRGAVFRARFYSYLDLPKF